MALKRIKSLPTSNKLKKIKDKSLMFSSFDKKRIKSLDQLKKEVLIAFENERWEGLYDGSSSEAVDDGQIIGRIELLHSLGKKLGLKLKDIPDFYDETIVWDGINGSRLKNEEE